MKKIVITLFFMLFGFAAIASAQITIAGQNFSMLVVVPLILMVVLMLIFGIVIAFDRYREKKEMRGVEKEKKEDYKFGIMEKLKEKIQKIEKVKKEPKKEEAIEEYRSLADYLDEISDLKKNFKKLDVNDAFKQLLVLIKNFFSDYLGLDYEITFEELENELRARNKEVVFFSKNLSEMSYNIDKISKRRVMMLLDEFEDVAKKIILKEETEIGEVRREKEVFVKMSETPRVSEHVQKSPYKISDKEEPKKAEIKEQKRKEEAKKTEYLNEEKKNRIIEMIREGRMYIKRDIHKANDIYEEIYILYHQLPKDKKDEVHKKIMEFYDAIRFELKS